MSFGDVALAIFLLLFALSSFVSAIPVWAVGIVAAIAGILILSGK